MEQIGEKDEMATSQKSQEKPAGNTKTAGSKNQLYRWFVTLPKEEITASQLSQHLKGFCKKFTFQGERGEGGYEHWQIELSLREKLYFQQFKNLLGFDKAHIEPTKNYFAGVAYCSKPESRIEGPYNEKSEFIKTVEELRPWQKKLEEELVHTEPDDRSIIWYCNKDGRAGKSQMSKYCAVKHNALIFNNGSFKDIACAIPEEPPKIVIFNFPRKLEERVNYTAIEAVKDGMIFSGKYQSGMKVFNSPHVVIFANFEPEYEAMTEDRWVVRFIDKEGNDVSKPEIEEEED